MRYPRLGKSGLRISELVLGSATFGELVGPAEVERIVAAALDHGISAFDTANVYVSGESERLLGAALRKDRQRVVICTKVGLRRGDSESEHARAFQGGYNHAERWGRGISPNDAGLSRLHIIAAVEESLRRLGTEWIDLYQVHRWDAEVPIEETLSALDDLVRAGKIRYIGCSHFAAEQLREAIGASETLRLTRFVAMQLPYNLLNRVGGEAIMPTAHELGVGLLTFQSLAGGMLTGRYTNPEGPEEGSRLATRDSYRNRYWNADTFAFVEQLNELAGQFGRNPEELALGWNLAQPAVTAVLLGAERPEDIVRNMAISERPLDAEQIEALRALSAPAPRIGRSDSHDMNLLKS